MGFNLQHFCLKKPNWELPSITSLWVTRLWDVSGKSIYVFIFLHHAASSLSVIKEGQSSPIPYNGICPGSDFHLLRQQQFCNICNSRIKSWILPGKLQHNFISFSLEDQLLPFPWEWSLRPVPLASEMCCSWPALFRMFSPLSFICFCSKFCCCERM